MFRNLLEEHKEWSLKMNSEKQYASSSDIIYIKYTKYKIIDAFMHFF